MLLIICLIFRQFQPGIAYKSVAYEKKRVHQVSMTTWQKKNKNIYIKKNTTPVNENQLSGAFTCNLKLLDEISQVVLKVNPLMRRMLKKCLESPSTHVPWVSECLSVLSAHSPKCPSARREPEWLPSAFWFSWMFECFYMKATLALNGLNALCVPKYLVRCDWNKVLSINGCFIYMYQKRQKN